MPRPPRAEIVRTFAGYHGRIVASNGEPLWTTEVLSRPRYVEHAFSLLGDLVSHQSGFALALHPVDERGLDEPRGT